MRRQRKKRAVRQNSNIFAMFTQKQIGEFKEAFSIIDHDSDGFIDKDDLKDMLASLGEHFVFAYRTSRVHSEVVADER